MLLCGGKKSPWRWRHSPASTEWLWKEEGKKRRSKLNKPKTRGTARGRGSLGWKLQNTYRQRAEEEAEQGEKEPRNQISFFKQCEFVECECFEAQWVPFMRLSSQLRKKFLRNSREWRTKKSFNVNEMRSNRVQTIKLQKKISISSPFFIFVLRQWGFAVILAQSLCGSINWGIKISHKHLIWSSRASFAGSHKESDAKALLFSVWLSFR